MLMNGQVVSTSLNNPEETSLNKREEEVEVERLMATGPGLEYGDNS